MRIKSKRLLSTLLSLALVFSLFAAFPLTASADNGNQLKTKIEGFAHGGEGELEVYEIFVNPITHRTFVHVRGTVTGAVNKLTLDINSDVTVMWKADYEGSINNSALIELSGSGTFDVTADGSVIQNGSTGAASAIRCNGANATLKVSSGTVMSTNYIALFTTGAGATVDVSGGSVGGPGQKSCPIWCSGDNSTVNISGGTVSGTGESYTIYTGGTGSAVNISGGIVNSPNWFAICINGANSKIYVSGGTVNSAGDSAILSDGANSAVNVSGGMVSSMAPYVNCHAIESAGAASAVTVSGGFVFANSATHASGNGNNTVIRMASGSPAISAPGIVCGWSKTGSGAATYFDGTSTDLKVSPLGATAKWSKSGSQSGISYANGSSTGFFPISGITVKQEVTQYTVTFNSNGGTSPAWPVTVNEGDTVAKPADPVRPGYIFGGWFTEEACINAHDFSEPVTADFTLFAQWTPAVKTVAVGAQSGTLTQGKAGAVSYEVTTESIVDGAYPITVANLPTGVSAAQGLVMINSNSSTLTLLGNTSTVAGVTNTLKLTIDGTESAAFTLTVEEPPEAPVMLNSMTNFKKVNTYLPGLFPDVNENEWYGYNNQKVVALAYEYGLMAGNSDGTFNPSGYMTIAEALAVASRIHSIYKTGSYAFTQGDPWHQVYVDYAVANDIITADMFAGNYGRPATRAEIAYIFSGALPIPEFSAQNTVNSLPDVNDATPYRAAIIMMYKAGVLGGSDELGTFNPNSSIIRAEAAAIISRVILPGERFAGKTFG